MTFSTRTSPSWLVYLTLVFACAVFCTSHALGQAEPEIGQAEPETGQAKGKKKHKSTRPAQRLEWYAEHVAMKESSLFQIPRWQFIGPTNISGRVTDVAVVTPKGKSYTMYAATASGGVWKTVNEGLTWEPVFEHAPSTSIGDVTIAPSNQEIVWIGTGEANIFRSSMAGTGVYKSTDGGKTWVHMGLTGTHTIPRIIIDPQNPDIVYVASSGHEWTSNKERGVYKTVDGGKTWKKIFYVDARTGVIDLVIDPSNKDTLYAATWQRIRKKWNDPRNTPKSKGSAIYRTDDGGANWTEITEGLPEARYRGRIGIDVARSNPSVVYAFVDNYELAEEEKEEPETDAYGRPKGGAIKGATVYRSHDRGATWKQVSEQNKSMERLSGTYGWVFGQVRVDPVDENKIYVMGLGLNLSTDGGKTFKPLGGMHGDHHALWIDPANTDYLLNGNDGGLIVSDDGGRNWRNYTDTLPVVQFYNVSFDMDEPFNVYGSIQDHGSRKGTVDLGRGRNRIRAGEWENAPGGEASSHAIDPTDPDVVYSEGFYGNISRSDVNTGDRISIAPKSAEGEPPLRGQWLAPFIISPHNPRIIYHGMNRLFRSMDRGTRWEAISPDLTDNNPKRLGDIPFQTIFALSESPLHFGLIYAGTDDGHLHVTRDSGATWTEIGTKLGRKRWVSRVVASAFDEGTVYVAQNGKRDDDFAVYLWKSTDFGATWHDLAGNIPGGPINVIAEDPHKENILYVGTDLGVYLSVDGGVNWHALASDLPTTFVHDLAVHPRDKILVAATHGRGMYALDVELIEKLDAEILGKKLHLVDTKAGTLPRGRWGRTRPASIHYFLKAPGKVVITILDQSKKKVQRLVEEGRAGLNAATWDLTRIVKPEAEDEEAKEGETKTRSGKKQVDLGTYILKIKAGKARAAGEITVQK